MFSTLCNVEKTHVFLSNSQTLYTQYCLLTNDIILISYEAVCMSLYADTQDKRLGMGKA